LQPRGGIRGCGALGRAIITDSFLDLAKLLESLTESIIIGMPRKAASWKKDLVLVIDSCEDQGRDEVFCYSWMNIFFLERTGLGMRRGQDRGEAGEGQLRGGDILNEELRHGGESCSGKPKGTGERESLREED
jgi:hypothetical protein